MQGAVDFDDVGPMELNVSNYFHGVELNSFLDTLLGEDGEQEHADVDRIDQGARSPPPQPPLPPHDAMPPEALVIDLTSDDANEDDIALVVVDAHHHPIAGSKNRTTTAPPPRKLMCKKRKLALQTQQKARHIRYDPEHMRSAECTQVCLDNQAAMEMYRQATTCAICLDTLQDLTSTPCGHIFCRQCLVHALEASKKCPMCQKPTQLHEIHALYL